MFKNSNMVAEDKQCYKKVKVFIVTKINPILCKKLMIIILTNVNSLFFYQYYSLFYTTALAAIPLLIFIFCKY